MTVTISSTMAAKILPNCWPYCFRAICLPAYVNQMSIESDIKPAGTNLVLSFIDAVTYFPSFGPSGHILPGGEGPVGQLVPSLLALWGREARSGRPWATW